MESKRAQAVVFLGKISIQKLLKCRIMTEKIQSRKYFPLLVDEVGSENRLSDIEDQKLWERYDQIDQKKQELLSSPELPVAIKKIGDALHLSDREIGITSLAVRKILFEEWTIGSCSEKIKEILSLSGEIDQKKLITIVEFIQKDILTIVPKATADEEESAATESRADVRIALLEALSRFPQLGQQTVTESRVKLRSSAEPTRGSLLNWIKCYREELGVGYHDSVTRGQFLFRSQNGAKLSDDERDRISLILRSIEDGEMLLVDSDRQQIVFPERVSAPKAVNTLAGAPERMPQFDLAQDASSARHVVPDSSPMMTGLPKQQESTVTGAVVAMREAGSGKEISSGSTGSMHVKRSETIRPEQSGTLHFSSKHVLPAEKDLLVQNDAERAETATPSIPIQPKPAPKRNPSYIPNPFRIDPVNSGRSDEE